MQIAQVERDEETGLVRRARAGDAEAFGALVEGHMRRAYGAALALVNSREDALDLSQEAFAARSTAGVGSLLPLHLLAHPRLRTCPTYQELQVDDMPPATDVDSRPHERYMRRCIELAARALVTGDAPVGALIVWQDEIVAEASESVRATGDVTAHAEIVAVRAACQQLRSLDLTDCTLYTSVEPCLMCAYAIRLARVSTVIAGARAAEVDGALSGWDVLATASILPARPTPALVRGVLARECREVASRRNI
jgi:tRNA(adenine34) deaminase